MAEFVAVFAHPRLTSDAYTAAVGRYFDRGIDVPIVIFADPTGREIPGTRLDHRQAQVKSTYLDHARKALEDFRGGLSPSKAKEQWADFGKALRLRTDGDPGAGIEMLVSLRDRASAGSPLRSSVEEFLAGIDRDEAAGMVEVGSMDLEGEDARMGLSILYQVIRDFPGLPSAKRAAEIVAARAAEIAGAEKADPAKAEVFAAAEREHRAWLALREADRLRRAGKEKEAAEAWKKVAADFEGTEAAVEAAGRSATPR